MKEKYSLIIVILCIVLLAFPLPRKVVSYTENYQDKNIMCSVDGWYIDFLILNDLFFGTALIGDLVYKPYTDHSASKIEMGNEACYVINVYRYVEESNDLDMQNIYLSKDLKDIYFEN